MAPLTIEEAARMIRGVKGAQILSGARGRPAGDVEALAQYLVNLSRFAQANAGRFRALDLNPIIVMPSGVVAVDLAIETRAQTGSKP
jgi:hypothetical protein